MFKPPLFSKFGTKSRKTSQLSGRKLLRIEPLERRELLTVNILTNTPTTGALTITGDNFDNNITVQPSTNAATPNTFTIIGNAAANGKTTQLQLNGVPVSSPYVAGASGNLVTGTIAINLGTGQNGLLFGFTTAPATAADPVAGALTISDNANDTNQIENVQLMNTLTILNVPTGTVTNTVTNTISNVQVGLLTAIQNGGNTTTSITNSQLEDNLIVTSPASPVVNASLTVSGCTIVGAVDVVNVSGGNTSTTVQGGTLQGTLFVDNGDGVNNVQIGSSTVATVIGTVPAKNAPILEVFNGNGGSFTQFIGDNVTTRLTVLGGVEVFNGTSQNGALNVVSFSNADVAGAVTIDNGGTPGTPSMENSVSIQDSNLGIQALSAATPNPVTVDNGSGYDVFNMTSIYSTSTAPWGVAINNTINGLNTSTVWGSSTTITGGKLGTGVFGPNNGTLGDGFDLVGDNGAHVVNLSGAIINGNTNLVLNGGSNPVTVQQKTQLAVLDLTTSSAVGLEGNDTVSINTSNITNGLNLALSGLVNNVTIAAGTTAGWGTLPNTLFYPISIVGNAAIPLAENTLSISTSLFTGIPLADIVDFTPTLTS